MRPSGPPAVPRHLSNCGIVTEFEEICREETRSRKAGRAPTHVQQLAAFGSHSLPCCFDRRASQTGTGIDEMRAWSVIALLWAIPYGGLAPALYVNHTTGCLLKTVARITRKT